MRGTRKSGHKLSGQGSHSLAWPSPRISTLFFPLLAFILAAGLIQVLAAGIGLSGPTQDFEVMPGGEVESHVRVWNEGSSPETFQISFTGTVAPFASANPQTFSLPAEQNRYIELTYSIPSGQASGNYQGSLIVSVSGSGISPTASLPVSIQVGNSTGTEFTLCSGLNLQTWLGQSGPFENVLPVDSPVSRIWRRNQNGLYSSAQYYPHSGVWWSPDESFSELETGKAYFFESDQECSLQVDEGSPPAVIHLETGINLVGWCHPDCDFTSAFPQSSSSWAVSKVWKRNADGSYSFAQYYPEQDLWWSADGSFTGVVTGQAYFIEAVEEVDLSP